jgi:cytochrome c-type biogenesis protein CcmH
MKHRVKELVAAGYSEGQIREYFIARYGEWVLLAPPSNGLGRLLWWSPALGLLAAAGVVGWRLRSRPVPAASPGDAAPGEADPYRKRLLAEVEAE